MLCIYPCGQCKAITDKVSRAALCCVTLSASLEGLHSRFMISESLLCSYGSNRTGCCSLQQRRDLQLTQAPRSPASQLGRSDAETQARLLCTCNLVTYEGSLLANYPLPLCPLPTIGTGPHRCSFSKSPIPNLGVARLGDRRGALGWYAAGEFIPLGCSRGIIQLGWCRFRERGHDIWGVTRVSKQMGSCQVFDVSSRRDGFARESWFFVASWTSRSSFVRHSDVVKWYQTWFSCLTALLVVISTFVIVNPQSILVGRQYMHVMQSVGLVLGRKDGSWISPRYAAAIIILVYYSSKAKLVCYWTL